MLSEQSAISIVQKAFPQSIIYSLVLYKNLYLFQVFGSDLDEGYFDPFYSVDSESGKVQEFSIITDADSTELANLLLAKNP